MGINVEDAKETLNDGLVFTDPSTGERKFYLTFSEGDPTGSAAPVNTWAMRRDTNTLFYKFGAGNNDWRQIRAEDIALPNKDGLFRAGINTTKDALINLREQRITKFVATDTGVVSSLIVTNTSNTLNQAVGTGSGFFFRLPDATTLILGQEYEFANSSSNPVTVQTADGTTLLTLNVGDIVRHIMVDNSTTEGEWVTQVSSGTATGIESYSVGSSTTFSTTSSSDVLITGLSVTPVSGRYGLWFSADIEISQNNRLAQCVTYVGGVAVERTRRQVQGVSSNFQASMQTVAEIEVNGTQTVDMRVNISSGGLDVNPRRLLLIRLGSVA